MNKEETKAYCEERYATLEQDNPLWHRTQIVNLIIQELRDDFGIRLTTPTKHSIVGIEEGLDGLIYHVDNLVREESHVIQQP